MQVIKRKFKAILKRIEAFSSTGKAVGGILTLCIIAIPVYKNHLDKPVFELVNNVVAVDGNLEVNPSNWFAGKRRGLCVRIDEKWEKNGNPESGILDEGNEIKWKVALKNWRYEPLSLGEHTVEFRFCKKEDYIGRKVSFEIVDLGVASRISSDGANVVLYGVAESRSRANEVTVRVTILGAAEEQRIELPVEKRVKSIGSQKSTEYLFELPFEGLPQFSPEDPEYSLPFFLIEVTDQAGNLYRERQSYAQFIAPGEKITALEPFSRVAISKMSDDVGEIKTIVSLRPDIRRIKTLENGEPAIRLRVEASTEGPRLAWDSPLDTPVLSVVFRDEHQVAATLDDSFLDRSGSEQSLYRVEQPFEDKVLVSTEAALASRKQEVVRPESEPSTAKDSENVTAAQWKRTAKFWALVSMAILLLIIPIAVVARNAVSRGSKDLATGLDHLDIGGTRARVESLIEQAHKTGKHVGLICVTIEVVEQPGGRHELLLWSRALQEIEEKIKSFPTKNTVFSYRRGSSDFVLLTIGMGAYKTMRLAYRISSAINGTVILVEDTEGPILPVEVSSSIGVMGFGHSMPLSKLLRAAGLALLAAKKAGVNQVVIAPPDRGREMINEARDEYGTKVIVRALPDKELAVELTAIIDWICNYNRTSAVVLLFATAHSSKTPMVAGVSADLVSRGLDARAFVKKAGGSLDGGGGGRKGLAVGGVKDISQLPEVMADMEDWMASKVVDLPHEHVLPDGE